MRVLLMHNPTAGGEVHSPEALIAIVEAAGHDVVWQSIKDSGWKEVLKEPADLVVVAGGDGTVRKVFIELAGRGVPATLLPVGSANNIARSLGFEHDDAALLVRAWANARRRPYDIGRLESPHGSAPFVESTGGGIFAEVLARAKHVDEKPAGQGKVEFGLRLLREVVREAPALPWRVEVDGLDVSGDLLGVQVMNVREAGPNILLAPTADPGDGRFEAVLIGERHRAGLADCVEARLDGRRADPPLFDVRRGQHIALGAPVAARLQVDDDMLATNGVVDAAARPAGRLGCWCPRPPLCPKAARLRERARCRPRVRERRASR